MGVLDFIRNGVRDTMIARPDGMKGRIVYKHPDQNIPMYAQLTVDTDESQCSSEMGVSSASSVPAA